MTNEFTVSTDEILLIDELRFLAQGGQRLRFGAVEGDSVHLHAVGSISSIRCLARQIIAHGTASRGHAFSPAA